MAKFSVSVQRFYFAAAVIIATMLLARTHYHGWAPVLARTAALADILVVGILALVYMAMKRMTLPGSFSDRLNRWTHWVLVLLVLLLAGLSQWLFVKTGELLNFDMLTFFLDRIADLKDVAAEGLDVHLFTILLSSLAFLVLACLRFSSRVLATAQYLALFLPIGLVFAGPLIQPEFVDSNFESAIPEHLTAARLYQGKYKNIGRQQHAWNTSDVAEWRRGILTGMPVSSLGASALQALANDAPVKRIYELPQASHTQTQESRPNVIFVILESVRYDALGVYKDADAKYGSNTPFLDEIARKGWRVERAYTTIPHTSKALVGIYCGTFARMETGISEAVPGNLPLNCLPRILSSVGYRTAHFQTAIGTFEDRIPFLDNIGFDESFTQESFTKEQNKWRSLGYLGIDDRAMIDPSIEWMRRQKGKGVPFFASMLTITTHHPYVTPSRIEAVHEPSQAKRAYDDAVRYADGWMRELFGKLRKQGLLDNTLLVITGDHGEAFSEHGVIAHSGTGYEEGMRVPLVLYGPMLGEHKVINGLRQHIDLMPTMLDVAGISYTGKLPGKSLLTDMAGHGDLITSCFYQNYCLTHLSADGGKVIFFYGKRGVEIYDLNSDPKEARNLYDEDTKDNALQRLGVAARMKSSFEAVYLPSNRYFASAEKLRIP